jgi:hypothetical protein
MNAATPPTIYARRGSVITVVVAHPSPFETLTLDEQSIKSTPPADSFQSVGPALTGALGKLSFVVIPHGGLALALPQVTVQHIQDEQKAVLNDLAKASTPLQLADYTVAVNYALGRIKIALQPPPGNVCGLPAANAMPWLNPVAWKADMDDHLQTAIEELDPESIRDEIASIDADIEALGGVDPSSIDTLNKNQATLKAGLAILQQAKDKLQALKDFIDNKIPDVGSPLPAANSTIVDSLYLSGDRNDQLETWALNSQNILAAPAKQFAAAAPADPFSALISAADITTPPAKTAVITITVQYMTAPKFEVSSGVMVPTTPFHSYAAAASSADASKTVVQQSLTYTVVPTANVNFLIKEFMTRQRAALFETTAVGYNPATSAVEFGEGLTFSWKSIEFSALADIGRDTNLAKGFAVNGTLPSASSKPGTTTVWGVRPAFAISIRLPLGGGSSNSSSGGGH